MNKRKQRNFKITRNILVLLLLALISYTIYTGYQIKTIQNTSNVFSKPPVYHYNVITDDNTSYLNAQFLEGLKAKSTLLNIVYEIKFIENISNLKSIKDAFDSSIFSDVDGVILKLSNNDIARDYINSCVSNNIPVITIGNDSLSSLKTSYIGTNKYNLGRSIASLIMNDPKNSVDVLVLFDTNYTNVPNNNSTSNNNFLNGILSINSEEKKINLTSYSLKKDQRSEIYIKNYLNSQTPDYIITTEPINSLRATKTLIDLNEIGNINLIASSSHPSILDYIRKGTILASTTEDYSLMGEMAIETLYEFNSGNSPSSYISVPFEITTKETVGDISNDE